MGAPVELVLVEAVVLIEGLLGDGSREARGEGAAEVLADAVVEAEAEVCEGGVGLDGCVCALRRDGVDGFPRMVEFEDWEAVLPALDAAPLAAVLLDLSIVAWRGC